MGDEPAVSSKQPGSEPVLRSTMQVFLAEALLLPTGLVTAAFLTRRLGPADYGLFTLVSVLVAWIQWSVSSLLTRTAVRLVGESRDWRPVGTVLLRLHLALSCGAALVLAAFAGPIGRFFGDPQLTPYLRLLAIDIPVLSLAHAHRDILVGVGEYRARALASAARWITRMVLIVVLLELGLSVTGAILGTIGASLMQLAISRLYVQPSPFGPATFPMRRVLEYAAPLSLFSLSMRLFDRLDLFLLKWLGESASGVGTYAAAQNLAWLPGILALSFSPVLLSTLTRQLRDDERPQARSTARNALRAVVCLLPFAAMTAGAAGGIVTLLYGQDFRDSAVPLGILIVSAVFLLLFSISTAMLVADGKPRLTVALALPLLPTALLCQLYVIPRWGTTGAALVTASVTALGAGLSLIVVYREWKVAPPLSTVLRSLVLCALAYELAAITTTGPLALIGKLLAVSVGIAVGFFALGEVKAEDRSALRRAFSSAWAA